MTRVVISVVILPLLSLGLINLCTALENSTDDEVNARFTIENNETCVDEWSKEICTEIIQQGNCNVDLNSWNCRQSCQLCNSNMDESSVGAERGNNERMSKCKDMLPFCEVLANPAICCKMKEVANETCQKACMFCYDMGEVPVVSSIPGMPPIPGKPEAPVAHPNPCIASGGGGTPESSMPGIPGQKPTNPIPGMPGQQQPPTNPVPSFPTGG